MGAVHMCGGQRTTLESLFSSPTMWVLGIGLRSLDLAAKCLYSQEDLSTLYTIVFNLRCLPIFQGQYSHLVLLAAFDCIDDTKLVKQIIISVSIVNGLELVMLASVGVSFHMLCKHFDLCFLSVFTMTLVASVVFYFRGLLCFCVNPNLVTR